MISFNICNKNMFVFNGNHVSYYQQHLSVLSLTPPAERGSQYIQRGLQQRSFNIIN